MSTTLKQRKTASVGGGVHPKEETNDPKDTTTRVGIHKDAQPQQPKRQASQVPLEPPAFTLLTSKRADAALAALGAALSLSILTWAAQVTKYPLMGSFLINTSVKLFTNRAPPSLEAFAKSSFFCIPAGTTLHYLFLWAPDTTKAYAPAVVVAASLFWWKLNGDIWTPANSLAIYIAVGSGPWGATGSTLMQDYPLFYLLAPYLLGHVYLYAFALAWSQLRGRVRAHFAKYEFFRHESTALRSLTYDQQQERLRELFDRMDLDRNGRLDVYELQLALRKALGSDIGLDEAKIVMKSTDTDGDSTLDFYEFCAAIDKLARRY